MFSSKIFALTLLTVACGVVVAGHQDYIYDQELIVGQLDFNRLLVIKKETKDPIAKCNLYNTELREMLGNLARNSLSARGLFQRVANVISNKRPYGAGLEIEGDLEECTALFMKGGYKGKTVQDASYSPSKYAAPLAAGNVDEEVVMGRLDFNGLLAVENEGKNKKLEERCSNLEEELREQLGDLATGLPQDDLFNRVVCVLDRRSAHFTSSLMVWDNLSSCLGEREHLPNLSETCWPRA